MGTSSPGSRRYLIIWGATLIAVATVVGVMAVSTDAFSRKPSNSLRIATTTSLDDSGLLDEILPDFENEHSVVPEVIAVGTGQALVLGERGDVDVLLVHAPDLEQAFVDDGHGIDRTTIMRNPFIIIGPNDDPANIRGANDASDALMRIADQETSFVSRGDDSGTHIREMAIWDTAGLTPRSGLGWYHAAGQGMGETLLTAHELEAYVLTDRATFVAMANQIPDLIPLYGDADTNDPLLDNPYSVIAVNQERHPDAQVDLAREFIDWITSQPTRQRIADYGIEIYDEPLFSLVEGS